MLTLKNFIYPVMMANIRKTLMSQLFLIIVLREHIEDYMLLSIVNYHYLISTDLNRQPGVVNCTNLGGISCLPGIIIHYNLFKIFLLDHSSNSIKNGWLTQCHPPVGSLFEHLQKHWGSIEIPYIIIFKQVVFPGSSLT